MNRLKGLAFSTAIRRPRYSTLSLRQKQAKLCDFRLELFWQTIFNAEIFSLYLLQHTDMGWGGQYSDRKDIAYVFTTQGSLILISSF